MAYTARIHKGDAMKELIKELNSIKKYIPYNTFHTIKGQIKSGNADAARTGINRIKKKAEGQAYGHTCH